MGRMFPFITVHEYGVGRSVGAFLSAPWLGVKYCVALARTQAFIWVGVYMFGGKVLCSPSPYPGIYLGGSLHV